MRAAGQTLLKLSRHGLSLLANQALQINHRCLRRELPFPVPAAASGLLTAQQQTAAGIGLLYVKQGGHPAIAGVVEPVVGA